MLLVPEFRLGDGVMIELDCYFRDLERLVTVIFSSFVRVLLIHFKPCYSCMPEKELISATNMLKCMASHNVLIFLMCSSWHTGA